MSFDLVYALHGFLGQGADWAQVRESISAPVEFCAPDLFTANGDEFHISELTARSQKKIFVGYSLGGRLGLRLLAQEVPFDHFIFISTNPGMPEGELETRRLRIKADETWAEQISGENWNVFLQKWNAQEVFKHSNHEPVRNIEEFDLNKLRSSLVGNSLGKQPDYSELIKKNKSKISWLVGRDDKKYEALANELKDKDCLDRVLAFAGGHRLHFDNPTAVAKIILEVLSC